MDGDLTCMRGIADYQFGRGCGRMLFPDGVTIVYSKNTGRIRHVYLCGVMVASFRPTDGFFTLTIAGAERMMSSAQSLRFTVTVDGDAACFVADGKSAFAKHVVEAGEGIRPGDEVIVVDEGGKVLAVGQALLNGREMLAFRVGIAVKIRRGRNRGA